MKLDKLCIIPKLILMDVAHAAMFPFAQGYPASMDSSMRCIIIQNLRQMTYSWHFKGFYTHTNVYCVEIFILA